MKTVISTLELVFMFVFFLNDVFGQISSGGEPYSFSHSGDQHRMIKTSTGKIFLPTEASSQVYVVVQGTP